MGCEVAVNRREGSRFDQIPWNQLTETAESMVQVCPQTPGVAGSRGVGLLTEQADLYVSVVAQ
jgi:hypothetical protein